MSGELTFGGLDWVGGTSSEGWTMHALANGADFGAPESLVEVLPRLLLDGEQVTHVRDSNRTLSFRVEVRAGDAVALARGEAALAREVLKPRNTLRWKPCLEPAAVSLFDSYRGSLRLEFDDTAELVRRRRVYAVSLPCAPYASSVDEVVVSATPVGGAAADVLVDACDSVSGWSWVQGSRTGDIDVSSSRYVTSPSSIMAQVPWGYLYNGLFGGWVELRRTFGSPVSMSTTPYLTFATYGHSNGMIPEVQADGSALSMRGMAALGAGWTRWWYACPDPSVTQIDVRLEYSAYGGYNPPDGLYIDDVRRTNVPPAGAKSHTLVLDIDGVVRTPGSIEIVGSAALGVVEVLTVRGVQPGFTPWLADWSDGAGGKSIPVAAVRPGRYAVVDPSVEMAGSWVTTLRDGGTAVVTSTVTTRGAPVLHLPPAEVSPNSTFTVDVDGPPSLNNAAVIPLEDASYTRLETPTGTTRVWIDLPSPDQPQGGVFVGTTASRSDARSLVGTAVQFGGAHQLAPPYTTVFVRTSGAAPQVSLRYRPRWHTTAPK